MLIPENMDALYGTNNLLQDSTEHSLDGLIKIMSYFKKKVCYVKVFFCGMIVKAFQNGSSSIKRLYETQVSKFLATEY